MMQSDSNTPQGNISKKYDYADRRAHVHTTAANINRWRAKAKAKGQSLSGYVEQNLLEHEAGDSAEVTRLRKLLDEERLEKEAANRAHLRSTQEVLRLNGRLETIEDHLLDISEMQLRNDKPPKEKGSK